MRGLTKAGGTAGGRRMIPSPVLLVVIGAYLKTSGVLFEGVFIGLIT